MAPRQRGEYGNSGRRGLLARDSQRRLRLVWQDLGSGCSVCPLAAKSGRIQIATVTAHARRLGRGSNVPSPATPTTLVWPLAAVLVGPVDRNVAHPNTQRRKRPLRCSPDHLIDGVDGPHHDRVIVISRHRKCRETRKKHEDQLCR